MDRRPPKVLVCFAVKEETRFFKAPAEPVTDGLVTGIGMSKASSAISNYLDHHAPQLILTCGFAGGLNPAHKLGQVLFDVTDASDYQDTLVKAGAMPGRFMHSDRVVVTAREKAGLFQSNASDAVEMESSAIVSACRDRNLPVIVLRVISDTAVETLPLDFNRYSREDGSLNMPKLLMGIARKPSVIPELMRFQGRIQQAAKSLGETLETFLLSRDLF